ncbi:L-aminoadipate-semialdehyde dehydrogenase [Mycena sanguinolenta]|uniref:L-aminoadipate-semialdehyde dehydrogenase n=1 Tax=Mycena sanguinolenta TaxID=230812 RepID=A0A8H7CUX7_9AGAR|nr:L-aminoadipate-semialdehyde dehydrogenase [Mycena sanguinolenta]
MDIFPTELWLEVFSRLPPAAHRSLSSTHRTLYDIARPLGFTEFTLYMYPYDLQPEKAQLDDALERLRFWTSPRIAPHVRSCTTSQNMDWQGAWGEQTDEHVLISAFFERLPRFTGLERLHADDIRFTRTGITNLCGLPALTYVGVSGWTIPPLEHMDPALTLRVAGFLARHGYLMNNTWFSLLSRDTLRELELYKPLALASSEVQFFPNVHTLRIERFSDTIHAVAAFNKLPNLRSFSSPNGDVFSGLTPARESSIFPVLKEYTGAHQNLHIFVQRTTLTHITLVSRSTFADFITELQGITVFPNITSVAVRFITTSQAAFGEAEIGTLFTLFPNLTELQLTLLPTEHGELLTRRMNSFFEILPSSPLPSTLNFLTFQWEFCEYDESDHESPPHAADIPDFPVLRAELVAKCPALNYIFFDRYHLLFLWWKTSSVWEATAYNWSDAHDIREQLKEAQSEKTVHTRF